MVCLEETPVPLIKLVVAFITRQGVVRKEHRPWAPAVLGSSLALLPTSWLALCKALKLSGLQFLHIKWDDHPYLVRPLWDPALAP